MRRFVVRLKMIVGLMFLSLAAMPTLGSTATWDFEDLIGINRCSARVTPDSALQFRTENSLDAVAVTNSVSPDEISKVGIAGLDKHGNPDPSLPIWVSFQSPANAAVKTVTDFVSAKFHSISGAPAQTTLEVYGATGGIIGTVSTNQGQLAFQAAGIQSMRLSSSAPVVWDEVSFNIPVVEAPVLSIQVLSIMLSWPTIPNQKYQVQYAYDFAPNDWYNFGDPLVGDGTELTVTDTVPGRSKRFYRVESVP